MHPLMWCILVTQILLINTGLGHPSNEQNANQSEPSNMSKVIDEIIKNVSIEIQNTTDLDTDRKPTEGPDEHHEDTPLKMPMSPNKMDPMMDLMDLIDNIPGGIIDKLIPESMKLSANLMFKIASRGQASIGPGINIVAKTLTTIVKGLAVIAKGPNLTMKGRGQFNSDPKMVMATGGESAKNQDTGHPKRDLTLVQATKGQTPDKAALIKAMQEIQRKVIDEMAKGHVQPSDDLALAKATNGHAPELAAYIDAIKKTQSQNLAAIARMFQNADQFIKDEEPKFTYKFPNETNYNLESKHNLTFQFYVFNRGSEKREFDIVATDTKGLLYTYHPNHTTLEPGKKQVVTGHFVVHKDLAPGTVTDLKVVVKTKQGELVDLLNRPFTVIEHDHGLKGHNARNNGNKHGVGVITAIMAVIGTNSAGEM